MKLEYDIIILGSGIAGLLLTSELSKHHSILIIEKQKQIPNNKYWLTDFTSYLHNPELKGFYNIIYEHLDFIAYNDFILRCFGKYVLWDSQKLIEYLKSSIEQNGGELIFSQKFYSYSNSKHRISVKANDKKYECKLIIDCMGFESPIVSANELVNIVGYYVLHGAVLKLKKNIDPICLSNVIISSKPRYLELFPTMENYAYTVLLFPQKYIQSNTDIHREFKFITSESEYKEYFDLSASEKKWLGGIVPVGNILNSSLDRIFLYGESAQMNPSATGTCLTKLLYNYKTVASFISNQIIKNKLNKNDLILPQRSFEENFNKKFQFNLYKEVLNFNSNSFYKVLKNLSVAPNALLNEILFSNIKLESLLKSFKQTSLQPNYFIIKLILRSILS